MESLAKNLMRSKRIAERGFQLFLIFLMFIIQQGLFLIFKVRSTETRQPFCLIMVKLDRILQQGLLLQLEGVNLSSQNTLKK